MAFEPKWALQLLSLRPEMIKESLMPVLPYHDLGGYLALDEEECRAAGKQRHQRYRAAKPFPHIVIDDLLDTEILARLADRFPTRTGKEFFDRAQERLKYQFHVQESSDALTRNILHELNSQAFLTFLEELTGIKGLIADPYFAGGGLHETRSGGHLSIHADFNVHDKMKVQRRLNLLVYLNEDWPKEFGGELELWDNQMKNVEVSVLPTIGRAVVFTTDLDSYHGQPDPVRCPPDRSRKSIATYYYTSLPDASVNVPHRSTNFRPRAGERKDWSGIFERAVADWAPPRLQARLKRLNPFE